MVWQGLSFDRYALGLMPCVIAGLILLYQQRIGPELPRTAVAMVMAFALVAIAGTHDWFAWQRSVLKGVGEVRAAGFARTEIKGGLAYDAWTQVSMEGHVNDARVKIPKDAYHPVAQESGIPAGCEGETPDLTPVIHAKYAVGLGPEYCYLPSEFPDVHYTAWLPPFHRVVEVQRVPGR